MLISSKGRYALRLMIYIAAFGDEEGKIALREVAERESISLKYLEQLVRPLMGAVACEGLDGSCGRAGLCSTVKFWTGLEAAIDAYVDGVTLAELSAVPEVHLEVDLSSLEGCKGK